jgi:hypothetical protein
MFKKKTHDHLCFKVESLPSFSPLQEKELAKHEKEVNKESSNAAKQVADARRKAADAERLETQVSWAGSCGRRSDSLVLRGDANEHGGRTRQRGWRLR